eukprot:6189892-Pleurochrysis_carterae.AAC.1
MRGDRLPVQNSKRLRSPSDAPTAITNIQQRQLILFYRRGSEPEAHAGDPVSDTRPGRAGTSHRPLRGLTLNKR